MTAPRKIRWLIAHQPQELFVRTARAFSEELITKIQESNKKLADNVVKLIDMGMTYSPTVSESIDYSADYLPEK